jgi:hypothetical protein
MAFGGGDAARIVDNTTLLCTVGIPWQPPLPGTSDDFRLLFNGTMFHPIFHTFNSQVK